MMRAGRQRWQRQMMKWRSRETRRPIHHNHSSGLRVARTTKILRKSSRVPHISLRMSKRSILSLVLSFFLVSEWRVSPFSINPSSLGSYPLSDIKPNERLRAESERLQTQIIHETKSLTEVSGNTFDHQNVDRSAMERKLVQLAADYVQDTAQLCEEKKIEAETADAIREHQTTRIEVPPPSMINERLPAFLKPIPSNSTKPTTTMIGDLAGGPGVVVDAPQTQLVRSKRGSRLLSFAGGLCARLASPFRKRRREPASGSAGTATATVVDEDECSPWA